MRISLATIVPLVCGQSCTLYSARQLDNQLNALQISNSFLLRSQRWVNIEKVGNREKSFLLSSWGLDVGDCYWKAKTWLHYSQPIIMRRVLFSILCFIFLPAAGCARQTECVTITCCPECTGARRLAVSVFTVHVCQWKWIWATQV